MLPDKRLKSGFTDEIDRRKDACRGLSVSYHAAGRSEPLTGRRYNGGNPWRAARNVNRGRASRAARRGLAGRRLVTPGL